VTGTKTCGCYDGPYSQDVPHTLVSVRCHQHEGIPALPKHSLMFRDQEGRAYSVKPGEGRTKYFTMERRDN
jgi:hypothetical protein